MREAPSELAVVNDQPLATVVPAESSDEEGVQPPVPQPPPVDAGVSDAQRRYNTRGTRGTYNRYGEDYVTGHRPHRTNRVDGVHVTRHHYMFNP